MKNIYLQFLLVAMTTPVSLALWSCVSTTDCAGLSGSVCVDGLCECYPGFQSVLGGTLCAPVAPYYSSSCYEDYQCSRLMMSYQCNRQENDTVGSCDCLPNHHYYLGRCWPSLDYGDVCTSSEQCQNDLRNPFSMVCNGVCDCAEGYYLRQRGECRRMAAAVGEGCVLDEDCQFENGVCDSIALTCYDSTDPTTRTIEIELNNVTVTTEVMPTKITRDYNYCSTDSDCQSPFVCDSNLNVCLCPVGYYSVDGSDICYAELGSPAVEETCHGLFAILENGICTCPPNFYFGDDMRDCVKAARTFEDSCISDAMCKTFGSASFCGPPEVFGLRSCICDEELAIMEQDRHMCRLFSALGEPCEVDSDCLAGLLEIQCAANSENQRVCTCPDDLVAVNGLCLRFGLGLNDTCQSSEECNGIENLDCRENVCDCTEGYVASNDICAPVLGGVCSTDADCAIDNTICSANSLNITVCTCSDSYTEFEQQCWPVISTTDETCIVSAQCHATYGLGSECYESTCRCVDSHHFRDGRCWERIGIFESCSRVSECYLGENSELLVCRNGLCQCDFDYPYSEELGTCISSASSIATQIGLLVASLLYLLY